jgi:multiple sugar transport system substrate-binding protein
MKRVAVWCMVLMLIGIVSVFAGGQKDTQAAAADSSAVTIRWAYWGSENRVRISQQAIDIFQAANPGFKVNPEPSGGAGDHFIKVDTQIAGGNAPDIIQMGGNINDYVKRDVLLPLEKYAGTILNTSVIDPSAIESGTINGHLYGVSTGVTMPALAYNKSLIERVGAPLPPKTLSYAEFDRYLTLLKSKLPAGVYPMQDIGALPSNSTPFGYWSGYNGTPLYDDVTNSTSMTAKDARRYLEMFKSMRDRGLVPPADFAAGYPETNADTSALVAGKVAIGYIWTNQLAGYQAAMTDEIDLMEFPGAAEKNSLWQAPSQFYTVNKSSKNAEAAVKFIDFLVNDPEAAKVLGNDRGASASATARAAGSTNPADQKVLDYLEIAGPHSSKETPHLPNDTEFNSTLYLIYSQVAFGQLTPEQGGKQIYDMIVRLINKQ